MCRSSLGVPAGATSDEDPLTTVFRLLSRSRRRQVLYVLRERDGAVPVERLAELLARDDDAGGPDGGSRDDTARERVESALRHVHLPKLTAAGAVEREADGSVRYAAGDALDGWVATAAAAEGA